MPTTYEDVTVKSSGVRAYQGPPTTTMAGLPAAVALLGLGLLVRAQISPLPGQVPSWPVSFSMNASSFVMLCSREGFLNASQTGGFSIVDVDWSNARSLWARAQPMNCEELLLQQALQIKQSSPSTRVYIYRNSVKMLPWFSTVREKLTDAAYAPWFLPFGCTGTAAEEERLLQLGAAAPRGPPCHVPKCDNNYSPPRCSNLYHDQEQTPSFPSGGAGVCAAPGCDCGSVPCGEYLLNFLALNTTINGQSLLEWLIEEYNFGPAGGGSPLVDGFFWDDQWEGDNSGPTEMEPHCVADLGLGPDALLAQTAAYNWSQRVIFAETIKRGRFAWQMFYLTAGRVPGSMGPTDGPLVHRETCALDLRLYCAAGSVAQTNAIIYSGSGSNITDLANFLLVRGNYSWLGTGWLGCDKYPAPPVFPEDYGVPLGLCAETAAGSGVFVREWSRATVQMDCSTFTPTITPK